MSRALLFAFAVTSLACGQPGFVPPRSTPLQSNRFSLNDVSFLLPLPSAGRLATLPAADATLFPKPLADALPALVEAQDRAAVLNELRIVSIRVDPCFPSAAENPSCVHQVRLVAQPVIETNSAVTTRDTAVHLFYTLDAATFRSIVGRTLTKLADEYGTLTEGPLDVHPVIRRQGLDGPYFGKLQTMVTQACTPQRLTRVAIMSVDATGRAWTFAAFNASNGGLVADQIPRLPMLSAQAFQEFGSETFRNGALVPSPPNDKLDTLLSESAMRLADPRTLQSALASAAHIEHPARSSPKTVDCASCHVATRARTNAEDYRASDSKSVSDVFTHSSLDLSRIDDVKNDPRALRAFGYLGAKSAFSQRTINESAAVADAMAAYRN